MPVYECVQAVI